MERTWQRTSRSAPSRWTRPRAGLEVGTQRALALVADEEQQRVGVVDELAQVVHDPAAGEHAAGGHDDHRARRVLRWRAMPRGSLVTSAPG